MTTTTTNAVPLSPLTTAELHRRLERARARTGLDVEVCAEHGGFTDHDLDRLLELGRVSNEIYAATLARGQAKAPK